MSPRFRADQIGSLLRPESLISARKALASSGADAQSMTTKSISTSSPAAETKLTRIQNSAIASVVRAQLDRNIRPITSGEYERFIFYSDFLERLSGLETRVLGIEESFRPYFPVVKTLVAQQGATTRNAIVCNGPVRYRSSPLLADWMYLRSFLPNAELWGECKITVPSPTYCHMQLKEGLLYPKDVYASDEAFFEDLAAAYRKEFETLYAAGVRNIQVDDPYLGFFCDPDYLKGLKGDGIDAVALLEFYVKVHNDFLKGLPNDLHLGLHICRGNAPKSVHYGSGSYEAIAQTVLTKLDYSTFYLEFDTERAGPFTPLRFLPRAKEVVLGLVTTKSPEMEDPGRLVARIYEAADVIAEGQGRGGRRTRDQVLEENLALSPQCGFSSSSVGGGKGVTEAMQWEKLELVKKVAAKVWGK